MLYSAPSTVIFSPQVLLNLVVFGIILSLAALFTMLIGQSIARKVRVPRYQVVDRVMSAVMLSGLVCSSVCLLVLVLLQEIRTV